MAEQDKPLRCSFCNKAQRDVKKLIAGPTVYICDECVDVCNEILDEDGIQAGRGPKAAARTLPHAEEYLRMAADLLKSENCVGAAREVRNAALEILRGIALFEREAATQWSETKVVLSAIEADPEIARLLQVEDHAHVLLRVSIDGAVIAPAEVQRASDVTQSLITILRQKLDAVDTTRRKPRA